MEISSAKKAIDSILKITGWDPDIDKRGEYHVELDSGILSFSSPDSSCIIIRQKLRALPENEAEKLNMCKEVAKINAGLAKLSRARIIIDGSDFVLEQVILSFEINESQIDEIFEDFLNDFDYIKNKVDSLVTLSPFASMQFLL